MDNVTAPDAQKKSPMQGIIDTAKNVILNPVDFYRGMPKVGGFADPLTFAVVMGAVLGVVQAVLGLLHLAPFGLSSIIVMPIAALIGSFIGSAIMFVIWKLMGSAEPYETAYRCGAYAMAVTPITAVVGLIPFVGGLIGLGWMLYLVVTSSVEVHKLPAKKAWLIFGIITAIVVLLMLGAQAKARQAVKFQQEMGIKADKDMTPEEAQKAAGNTAAAFMKAMQEQAAKQAAQDQKAKEE